MDDNDGVECRTCREALSARLDGEPEGVPADQVDAHLDGCASCREWHDGAAALNRVLRVRPAARVPDLTAAILDAAPPITPPTPKGALPRGLLTGVAVAQIALGLAQVLGVSTAHSGHTTGVDSTHLFNESTAWNLALGLGLLWTALRPSATAGVLPVTAAFVAVLIPYSASDLLSGTATAARVFSHSLLVVGLVLLAFVHFGRRDPGGRTPLHSSDSGAGTRDTSSSADRSGRTRTRRRIRLRPVSRRDAA
ncbi:zf-HC2 domain-containing protein [Lentzea sp. NPDC058436]|uniref:zf-HC2 domain-containing protein n=1 Tax=Lentzea sp. NPDC058436 TaxID=3346499 RepID=UPI0036586054